MHDSSLTAKNECPLFFVLPSNKWPSTVHGYNCTLGQFLPSWLKVKKKVKGVQTIHHLNQIIYFLAIILEFD